MDNEELIHKTQSGDSAALEELLCRNIAAVRAYSRLRMGPALRAREEISDIVQSVCREALQDLGTFEFRGDASFRAWLCLQAERKLQARARYWNAEQRDQRRTDQRQANDDSLDELSHCYASLHSPSGVAAAHELVSQIEGAFDRLSEQDRDLIVLSRIVGLSGRGLAEHIGRDEHSTRTMLSRALARLARLADV